MLSHRAEIEAQHHILSAISWQSRDASSCYSTRGTRLLLYPAACHEPRVSVAHQALSYDIDTVILF